MPRFSFADTPASVQRHDHLGAPWLAREQPDRAAEQLDDALAEVQADAMADTVAAGPVQLKLPFGQAEALLSGDGSPSFTICEPWCS